MKDAPPRPRCRLAAALPLVFLGSLVSIAPALAQNQEGEQETEFEVGPPSEEDEATATRLELTVGEALELALANNIELERSVISNEVARYDALGSWGAFNWLFDAGVTASQSASTQAQSQAFGGELVVFDVNSDSTNGTGNFDFTKPLRTGGRFDITFDYFNNTSDSSITGLDPSTTTQGVDVSTLGLAYTQPLLRGAWENYATSTQREAEVNYLRQLEFHREVQHRVLLAVQNAYWDLVAALEQRDVARSALDLGMEQLRQNERRRAAGVGTDVDVLQAQAEVATRIEGLIAAEASVQQAMDDLRLLLFPGNDEGFRDLWDASIAPVTPLPEEVSTAGVPPWEHALEVALTQRPELQQRRLELDAARLQHERTVSEQRSLLDFNVGANSSGREFATKTTDDLTGGVSSRFEDSVSLFDFDIYNYSAGLVFNMPIGNVERKYRERAARSRLRSAHLFLEQAETDVLAEVRRAVRDVASQAEAVRAAAQSLELAAEQLEAEQARFAEGLSTNFQVLQFQQSWIEALSRERTTRVDFKKREAALSAAQGLIGVEAGTER